MSIVNFNGRTTTWNAIGTSVEGCTDLSAVLSTSGLDYEVSKYPISTKIGGPFATPIEVPNRFVTARTDGSAIYDVVSDKFEVIQNSDAFDFVNYMGDDLQYEKAGETATGMVYIIARLPDVDILGDTFTPYVLFRNGFSGKVRITAAICPLRIICQNQFNVSFAGTQNTITVRHVQNAEAKLAEARETLKMSADYMNALTMMANRYATIRMTPAQISRVIDLMFPMDGVENMNPFKRKTLEDARTRFLTAHAVPDNNNFRGTAWGLINAYTDFITHQVPAGKTSTRFEGKFMQVTFGQPINNVISIIDSVAA